MAEYAGYIPGKSIDWLSLAKGVKTDIDQGLKAREERKAADEKLVTDVSSKLRSWESTQNKSFNEVVLNGLDKARTQALDWNKQLKSGQITRNEYQRRMNNLNDSFDSFATTTKNFDQYVVGINKRQEEGLSSSFEMFSADLNSRLMNIGTKDMNIGDSGDFFVTDLVDGSVQNVRNYTNMNNIVDNKIDVAKAVDNVVSKWDAVTLQQLKAGGATVLTEDPRLNAAYQKTKADLVGSLVDVNNPRGIVSVLLDNSDLDYSLFYTADDAKKVLAKAVQSKEMTDGKAMSPEERAKFEEKYFNENMIQVVQDNDGKYQPKLTDKMIADAKVVVENQVEQQLGFKKEEERGFAPSNKVGNNGDGNGGGGGKKGYELYETLADAWKLGDVSALNSYLKAKSSYKLTQGKKGSGSAYILNKVSKDEFGDETLTPVISTNSLEDMIPYYYGTGASAKKEGERQMNLWRAANSGGGGSKPKAY
jgi:hypothetical protein